MTAYPDFALPLLHPTLQAEFTTEALSGTIHAQRATLGGSIPHGSHFYLHTGDRWFEFDALRLFLLLGVGHHAQPYTPAYIARRIEHAYHRARPIAGHPLLDLLPAASMSPT